ncbi:MAG: hypothetical protein DRQ45_07630 [Gammaproteobacteria bacterium]|nr:MAG: hypothetical protein DRQ45_07630 [Gammaproteobacteria bacterium]
MADNYGRTALIYAAGQGFVTIAVILIEGGADVNATDTAGKTVLDYTIGGDKTQLTELLQKHGAMLSADIRKDMSEEEMFDSLPEAAATEESASSAEPAASN